MANYEFGGQHEVEFGKAGYWMGQVGLLAMFFGGLQALGGLLRIGDPLAAAEAYANLFAGVIYVIFGYFIRRSGTSFKAIASSEGQDMDHLLTAVGIAVLFLVSIGAGIIAGYLAAGA